jgi:hypothetical protein
MHRSGLEFPQSPVPQASDPELDLRPDSRVTSDHGE